MRLAGPGALAAVVKRRLDAARRTRLEDGIDRLACAIEALDALEARLAQVEDAVTSGDAMTMPDIEPARTASADPPARLLAGAHLIGALVRRINLRLGAIEQALDGRAPAGLGDPMPIRSPRRIAALVDRPAERPRPRLVETRPN